MANHIINLIALAAVAVILLGSTVLPAKLAYSQASQWTWDSPVHTNCDGFTISNAAHSSNTIAGFMSMPMMRVYYPDSGGTVLTDHPGLTGCAYSSYTYHFPHTHTSSGTPPYTYIHAIWFVGGCSDFVLLGGCYKYEQLNYFYNSGTSTDPRFRHLYKAYGIGFADSLGYPQYSAYFRINTDVLGSGGDSFQRWTGSSWSTVSTESSYFAYASTGAQFRVYDSSSTTKYLEIYPLSADNIPKVWILQYSSSESDPTGNSIQNPYNEPSIWDGTGSVNGQDIVYWYKTYTISSSSTCVPTSPCTMGPSVYLRGGL